MNVLEEDVFQPAADDVVPDPMMNWVIRGVTTNQSYKKSDYVPIKPDRFNGLEGFTFSAATHPEAYTVDVNVYSMEGLQYGTDLRQINLNFNMITDLSPLQNLSNLRDISFKHNQLTTLAPLKNLTGLQTANFEINQINDIKGLAGLTSLEHLTLTQNKLSDITGIEGCTSLKALSLSENNITDISKLSGLTQMETFLWLESNNISDITSLSGMTKLKELDLYGNQVSDISVLAGMKDLETLNLANNAEISDITPLVNLIKLESGNVNLSGTKIETKKKMLFQIIDVNKLIARFNPNAIRMIDKGKVEEAKKAYNKLSEEAKGYIVEERITAAEDNIKLLEAGQEIAYYDDLQQYEEYTQPDYKTFEARVTDASGQPLSHVGYEVKKRNTDTIVLEASTDGNGVVSFAIPEGNQEIIYMVQLKEGSKFEGDTDDIFVHVNDKNEIIEVNEKPVSEWGQDITLTLKDDEQISVDKCQLNQALKAAQSYKESTYTPETYQVLKQAMDNATTLIDSDNVTQTEIDDAQEALLTAMDGLVKGVDYSTVNITAVDEKGNALKDVAFIVSNAYNSGKVSISTDQNGQVSYTVSNLAYITYAIALDSNANYTMLDNKDGELRLTVESGKITEIGSSKVTGEDDLNVTIALQQKEGLKADRAGLLALIEKVSRLNRNDYTTDSWTKVSEADASARLIMNDENASADAIESAKTKLKSALDSLVKVGSKVAVLSVELSSKSITYDGKVKHPSVVAKNNEGKVIPSSDYIVKYPSGSKNVGRYVATVGFKNNYTGTYRVTYDIVPKTTKLTAAKGGAKKISVKWKKQKNQTTGYEVQTALDKKFKQGVKTVGVKKSKTVSVTVKKLKGKKKYYVRIRTYKQMKIQGKTVKLYSSWSKVKVTKTKK